MTHKTCQSHFQEVRLHELVKRGSTHSFHLNQIVSSNRLIKSFHKIVSSNRFIKSFHQTASSNRFIKSRILLSESEKDRFNVSYPNITTSTCVFHTQTIIIISHSLIIHKNSIFWWNVHLQPYSKVEKFFSLTSSVRF